MNETSTLLALDEEIEGKRSLYERAKAIVAGPTYGADRLSAVAEILTEVELFDRSKGAEGALFTMGILNALVRRLRAPERIIEAYERLLKERETLRSLKK